MSVSFTDLIAGARFSEGALRVAITPDWMQGRTAYGGLSAAICLETALRAVPDAPPLRSAVVTFVGPIAGDVEARGKILRQGKSVTVVEAEVSGAQGLATRCVFAFGAARASQWNRTFTPKPEMAPPEACGAYFPDGKGRAFLRHFDARLAKGGRPASGSHEYDHFIWVRHKDVRANGVVALVALADMPPPALYAMFTKHAPISSMTWMANVLCADPETRDGWWLLEMRAEHAGDGYASQDMLVWSRDGGLVIAGRQCVAVFS